MAETPEQRVARLSASIGERGAAALAATIQRIEMDRSRDRSTFGESQERATAADKESERRTINDMSETLHTVKSTNGDF